MNGPSRSDLPHRLRRAAAELVALHHDLPLRERLRTGLAQGLRAAAGASLGYFGARWLGLGAGFWAAITAIAVTQGNYAGVKNLSRDQLAGALVGGAYGLASAVWGHDRFPVYLLAVLLGMLTCWALKLGSAGRISGITTTIVMLVPLGGGFAHIALMRVAEVALGALGALLVARAGGWLEGRLAPPR